MMLAYEVILLAWLNLYGALLSRIGRSRLRRRFTQALQKVTGAVLIGLGVRLVLEPR
jgi:threonine/homoserine/homoserine lactone efflux protein